MVFVSYTKIGGLMKLSDFPPQTLTLLGTILALVMADDLTSTDQANLGNFLMLVGQALVTNAGFLQYQQQLHNEVLDVRLKKLEESIAKMQKL